MRTKSVLYFFLFLAIATPAGAQRTTTASTKASPITAAEAAAIRAAFKASLGNAVTRDAVRTAVLQQLRATKPIAFANGHWIVPIDVAALYGNPAIKAALVTQLAGNSAASRLGQVATLTMADRLAFVVVPNQMGDALIGISVANLRNSMAEAAFLRNMTGMIPGTPGLPGNPVEGAKAAFTGATVVFGLTRDILGGLADAFTNWWTGAEGPQDPNTGLPIDHPNADPDGDNIPNRLDGDDDEDGTPDEEDQAPYDPGTQICFDCMNRAMSAAFTNTAASGVLKTAFNAHTAATNLAKANRLVSLGTAARVAGQNVALQVGFVQ
jgi:hypothetical protein